MSSQLLFFGLDHTLFITNITPIFLIDAMRSYCREEGFGFIECLWCYSYIFLTITFYILITYFIISLIRKVFLKNLNLGYLNYSSIFNILIRLLPFGYTITILHSIHSGKSFWRGLIQEIAYTIGTSLIYLIGFITYIYIGK